MDIFIHLLLIQTIKKQGFVALIIVGLYCQHNTVILVKK